MSYVKLNESQIKKTLKATIASKYNEACDEITRLLDIGDSCTDVISKLESDNKDLRFKLESVSNDLNVESSNVSTLTSKLDAKNIDLRKALNDLKTANEEIALKHKVIKNLEAKTNELSKTIVEDSKVIADLRAKLNNNADSFAKSITVRNAFMAFFIVLSVIFAVLFIVK